MSSSLPATAAASSLQRALVMDLAGQRAQLGRLLFELPRPLAQDRHAGVAVRQQLLDQRRLRRGVGRDVRDQLRHLVRQAVGHGASP